MSNHLGVMSCGHWFRESWADTLPPPVDGEYRICANEQHYPQRFATVYLTDPGPLALDEEIPAYRNWRDAFHAWLAKDPQRLANLLTSEPSLCLDIERALADAWLAALKTVERSRTKPLV